MERMLTEQDVAELLGITVRAIRRLRSERRIRYVKAGRSVRFRPADVDAYLDRQTVETI
jgi:excisionase family DNA binding protein